MGKFYYQLYDNAKQNTVNSQQMYRMYPPTFDEVQNKWRYTFFKDCKTGNDLLEVLNMNLYVKSFKALLKKSRDFPVIYNKWGLVRKSPFIN